MNFFSLLKREILSIIGKKRRDLSYSKICIGIACDNTHANCAIECTGKSSMEKTTDTFIVHIKTGST